MKKNKIISDWLEEHGDPEICKQVERKLEEITKERSNQIIDEVYNKYTKKYVGYDDVPSKELFIFEIKNNPEFSERWGLKIEERELSLEERYKIALPIWKEKYGLLANMMVPTNVDNTPYKIPTKLITITYKDKKIESYE
jgi:hypothetical protein